MNAPAPTTVQDRMVAATKGLLAERLKGSADFHAALVAADSATGIVIADEAGAILNAETALTIARGLRAGDTAKAAVLGTIKAIEKAVNALYAPQRERLQAGLSATNRAKVSWDMQLKAAHEAAEREAKLAAEKQRLEAAAQAEEAAEEFVPLDDPTPAPPPRTIVTTAAGAQTTSWILKCEPVAWDKIPEPWLLLNEAAAKERFRDDVRYGDQPDAPQVVDKRRGDNQGVVVSGVRYWREPSVANRVAR